MIVAPGRQPSLCQELALLAIEPEHGRLRGAIGYGLAAAALYDLVLLRRITLDGGVVRVSDERPTGDAVLDEALCSIVNERWTKRTAQWVRALGRTRDLRERMIRSLEADGLVRRLDERPDSVLPAERYSVVPHRLRAYLVARVRATLLERLREASERDVALAVVLASIHMLDRFFARDERELAYLRISLLIGTSSAGSTLAAALSEVRVLALAPFAAPRAATAR